MTLGQDDRTRVEWQAGHLETFRPRDLATTSTPSHARSAAAPAANASMYRIRILAL
jgi:hypothetical protein